MRRWRSDPWYLSVTQRHGNASKKNIRKKPNGKAPNTGSPINEAINKVLKNFEFLVFLS